MAVKLHAPQGRWWVDTDDGRFPLLGWTSYRTQVPRSGVGGFELEFPRSAPNAERIMEDLYASLVWEVMADNGQWIEPPQGRFLALQRAYNPGTETVRVAGGGLGWLLGRVIRAPYAHEGDGDKIQFTDKTAGYILRWFWNDQQRRRAVQGVEVGFDNVLDSNGDEWEQTFTLAYDRGVTLRQVLDGFASAGVQWRFDGVEWQVAQGAFRDVPTEPLTLYDGIDVSADVIGVGVDEAAGTVWAFGGASEVAKSEVPVVPRWGRWEVAQNHSGTTGAALARLAEAERVRRGAVRFSTTVTLLPSARFRPWETIFPDQQITVRFEAPSGFVGRWDSSRWDDTYWGGPDRWWEAQSGRIEEMLVADNGRESTVSLTVGERALSPDDLMRSTVSALTGGVVVRGTATGRA